MVVLMLSGVLATGASSPSRAADQDVKHLLTRMERNAEQFRGSLSDAPDREWLLGWEARNIDHFVTEFVAATRLLRAQFDRGQVAAGDVDAVLRRGASIDSFMEHRRSVDRAQREWVALRRDLEVLAIAYNATWSRAAPRLTSVEPAGRSPHRGPAGLDGE